MLASQLAGLVATLAVAMPPAAGTAPVEPSAAEAPDPQLERARELYQQGEARFATADFAGAIELWTEAFSIVPDSTDAARIKALLIYNLATARERAFEISGDVSHLRQAKILMEDYAASIPALFGDSPEGEDERAKITGRLNTITAQIDAADRKKDRERGRTTPDERPDADDQGGGGRGATALIGVGAAALAVGVGGLAMMGAGLGMGSKANDLGGLDDDDIDGRRAQFDRGRTGNTLAIAGGVVGGVFAITGAVLVGIGASRKAQAKRAAFAPWFGGRTVGLGVRGRF